METGRQRIEWNELNKKEVDEAKRFYMEARKLGRTICDLNGNPVEYFKPSLQGFIVHSVVPKQGEIIGHFFDESGDRRIIWNTQDPNQIKESFALFNDYLARGWKAYAIDAQGKRGARIFFFDEKSQEIIFDDKTTREKLSSFSKKFQEVKVLPKTFPG